MDSDLDLRSASLLPSSSRSRRPTSLRRLLRVRLVGIRLCSVDIGAIGGRRVGGQPLGGAVLRWRGLAVHGRHAVAWRVPLALRGGEEGVREVGVRGVEGHALAAGDHPLLLLVRVWVLAGGWVGEEVTEGTNVRGGRRGVRGLSSCAASRGYSRR